MKTSDPPNRLLTGDSSGRMGEWGAACAILILVWVTSCGAQSGDRGGGSARSWWTFFSDVAPFLGRERPGRRGKIMSDLKKCNESWSIGRGRLARETLAIKWRGLCDIMLVWFRQVKLISRFVVGL